MDSRGDCSGKTLLALAAFTGDAYVFETLINDGGSADVSEQKDGVSFAPGN